MEVTGSIYNAPERKQIETILKRNGHIYDVKISPTPTKPKLHQPTRGQLFDIPTRVAASTENRGEFVVIT